MKKPIRIISNDWHLKEDNIEKIKNLVIQKCELAKKLKVNKLICLGDIFHSRIAQRLSVLNAFKDILDIILSYGMELKVIAGNHDKTDYSSVESFLDPFDKHPAINLIRQMGGEPIGDDLFLNFIPFFKEDRWIEEFNQLEEYNSKSTKKHILLTHIAVTGSTNNDGSKIESSLKVSTFKKFHSVLSGHYHDTQTVGEKFFHLPSICQNNFGENDKKGFTILYDDGTHELHLSDFPKYNKITVDMDKVSVKELDKIVKDNVSEKDNVRIELIGSEAKIKAVDKNSILIRGIDVKAKVNQIEDTSIDSQIVEKIDNKKMKEEFGEFCEKEELNYEEGLIYFKN